MNELVRKLQALNPYDRSVIPGSVLKIENDNYDPRTGKQRQLGYFGKTLRAFPLAQEWRTRSAERGRRNNKKDRWSRHGFRPFAKSNRS